MTCLIGDGSPGREGTGLPCGMSTRSSFSSRYGELPRTVLVYLSSVLSSNGSTTEAVPVCSRPTYSTAVAPKCTGAGRTVGFGPFGFAKLRSPRPFRMMRRPSDSDREAVGYQPDGTNP